MFTIQLVKDLVWEDQQQTVFSCNVKFQEFDELVPIAIRPTDIYKHTQTIRDNAIAGVYGSIAPFAISTEPNPDPAVVQPTSGVEEM